MTHPFEHVAAVIVTYNCGEEFCANLKAIMPQVKRVVIVDNSTEQATLTMLKELEQEYASLKVIYNGSNIGLGAAQNIGIREACAAGAEWVLLLDDDSYAEAGMIAAMGDAYVHNPEKERIGICTPVIVGADGKKNYRYLMATGNFFFRRSELHEEYLNDVLSVIGSGSLIRSAVLKEIGLMREDFFIDCIDLEFCLRVIVHGWIITAVNGARLRHHLGHMKRHRLLGRNFYTTNHSIHRRYLYARNRMIFWRLYMTRTPFGGMLYFFLRAFYELLLVLFFEEQKSRKIFAILKGSKDGMFMKNIHIAPPSL